MHPNVAETVDAMLRGIAPTPEIRSGDANGQVTKTRAFVLKTLAPQPLQAISMPSNPRREPTVLPPSSTRVLPFGVSRDKLEQLVKGSRARIAVVQDLNQAEL